MSRFLMSFAAVAAIVLSLGSPALAQNDLERILEREKIAAQKLQDDVTGTLSRSRTLEKAEPGRAADLLQETLTKVRNSTELPAEERTQLVSRLQARIREGAAVIQERARADEDAVRLAQQKLNQEGR